MPLRVVCPRCSVTLSVPETLQGKKIRCTKCQEVFLNAPPKLKEAKPLEAIPVVKKPSANPGQIQPGLPPQPAVVPPPQPLQPSLPPVRPRRRRSHTQPRKPLHPILVAAGVALGVLFILVGFGLAIWQLLPLDSQPTTAQVDQRKEKAAPRKEALGPAQTKLAEKNKLPLAETEAIEQPEPVPNPPIPFSPVQKGDSKQPLVKSKPVPPPQTSPKKKFNPLLFEPVTKENTLPPPPMVVPPPVPDIEPELPGLAGGGVDPIGIPVDRTPVGNVKPAPLKADRVELRLPGTVADTCVGAGGRFFILHLPKMRNLAVFDVNEAKIVEYIPVAGDNIKFTASMNKLFVVYPDKNIIQRFSLLSFEREVTAPLRIRDNVLAIHTGSAATGPLFVHYKKGHAAPVTFLDPVTFKELDVDGVNGYIGAEHFRASPDGTVFGGWPTSFSQSMISIVHLGKSVKIHRGPMAGIVVPSADNTLVTAGGIYTPECKDLGSDKTDPRYRLRLPSQTGKFYVTCPGGGGAQINTGRGDEGQPVKVYMVGDSRPITTVPSAKLPACNESWTRSDFTQDKRVLFVPEGKLLAILPLSNDRLILHRLDIDKALDKSGIDYLFVTSRPPAAAYRGSRFTYTPKVKSKKGNVRFKIEFGPEGMSVAPDGTLNWRVPPNLTESEVRVLLTVTDASGQEVFHSFKLAVADKTGNQP